MTGSLLLITELPNNVLGPVIHVLEAAGLLNTERRKKAYLQSYVWRV